MGEKKNGMGLPSWRRLSLAWQFAGIFTGLMALSFLLLWFINNRFLESYYRYEKEQVLEEARQKLLVGLESDFDEDFVREMDDFSLRGNLTALVLDSESAISYSSGNGGAGEMGRLGSVLFFGGAFPKEGENVRVGLAGDRGREYLEMVGSLEDGHAFILRTPMESIRDSVMISNKFTAYVGMAMSLVCALAIVWISRRMTAPIQEMTRISGEMIHMRFEARCRDGAAGELGELGANLNRLSHSLEQNITRLKKANRQLEKDLAKREEADRMRREFLSNVSHELKTPLALIQGYGEGLQEGIWEEEEKQREYLAVIVDEAGRMNRMLEKLLILNRLEFGGEEVETERFDLAGMALGYAKNASLLAESKGIRLEVQKSDPLYVWGDSFLAQEVLMNYLSNALRYAQAPGEGEPARIRIYFQCLEEKIRLCVCNTGQPIPQESLPRLWEKFYKADKARSREYGGSGIGLSIVKAIMEAMGQGYGVENMQDGVMFWFSLEKAGGSFGKIGEI